MDTKTAPNRSQDISTAHKRSRVARAALGRGRVQEDASPREGEQREFHLNAGRNVL